MIAQKLLGQDLAVAAVAIDAAQIKGVLPLPLSALRATLPVFKNPANKHRAVSLTAEQFRYALRQRHLRRRSPHELFERWTIPAPGKPLFEAAAANFNPHSPAKVDTANADARPAAADHRRQGPHRARRRSPGPTLKQYRHSDAVTDLVEFPDRGHSLTIDNGWREVADTALALAAQAEPLTG